MVSRVYNSVWDIGSRYINKSFSTTISERRKAKWKLWLMVHRDLLLMSKGLLTSCQISKSSLLALSVGIHWALLGNLVPIAPLTKAWICAAGAEKKLVGRSQSSSCRFGKNNHGGNQGSKVMSWLGCRHQGHTNYPDAKGDNEGYP